MCKSGCYNEDCWGDCTVSYKYCEVENMDRIKNIEKELNVLSLWCECEYPNYNKEVNKLVKELDKFKKQTNSFNYCEVQKLDELKAAEKELYIIGLYDECDIDYKEVDKLLKKVNKIKNQKDRKIGKKGM